MAKSRKRRWVIPVPVPGTFQHTLAERIKYEMRLKHVSATALVSKAAVSWWRLQSAINATGWLSEAEYGKIAQALGISTALLAVPPPSTQTKAAT